MEIQTMKTTELIATLNAINTRYGAQALNRWVNIDAIDSCDANYIVVAQWKNDEVSIYITDDAEKFVENTYLDDDTDAYFAELKSITIWHTINGVVHSSQVF